MYTIVIKDRRVVRCLIIGSRKFQEAAPRVQFILSSTVREGQSSRYVETHLALKNCLVVDWPANLFNPPMNLILYQTHDLRIHCNAICPVIMRRCETTLRRRLKSTAIRVLRNIPSFVVDDCLDKCREFLVLAEERVVMSKLLVYTSVKADTGS